jgi:transposase
MGHCVTPALRNYVTAHILAERTCRRCPVRRECADHAAQAPVYGLWAGVWHSEKARRQQAA